MAPDSVLPAERLLAERFDVSRIIVRQAIFTASTSWGSVRVKQGGATRR